MNRGIIIKLTIVILFSMARCYNCTSQYLSIDTVKINKNTIAIGQICDSITNAEGLHPKVGLWKYYCIDMTLKAEYFFWLDTISYDFLYFGGNWKDIYPIFKEQLLKYNHFVSYESWISVNLEYTDTVSTAFIQTKKLIPLSSYYCNGSLKSQLVIKGETVTKHSYFMDGNIESMLMYSIGILDGKSIIYDEHKKGYWFKKYSYGVIKDMYFIGTKPTSQSCILKKIN